MKSTPLAVIVADAPDALVRVCGVTMVDRLLRVLERAGFDIAIVLTGTPGAIRAELTKKSWARAGIQTEMRTLAGTSATFGDLDVAISQREFSRILLLSSGFYFDVRLIEALLVREESRALVDSNPKHLQCLRLDEEREVRPGSFAGAFLLEAELIRSRPRDANLFSTVSKQIEAGEIPVLDVATLPSFLVQMRRHIRPLWFPSPPEATRATAETLVLDTAQKGAMEMISYLETPVENWLMRRLWNTSITPVQITFFGLIVGALATIAFASGHLWAGVLLALSVGVIDGLDGKQARVKVETTELGRWEGEMDYPVQMSWWIALAYYFAHAIPASHPIRWVLVFLAADIVDKIFTRSVKQTTGRYLESFSPIDRFICFFAGPRSLYVCIMICGLLLEQPYRAFVTICCWHLSVACLHGVRATWICSRNRRALSHSAGEVASPI